MINKLKSDILRMKAVEDQIENIIITLAIVFVSYIVKLHYYSSDYASIFTIIFWIAFCGKYFVKTISGTRNVIIF